jgi:DNA-binding GntR family transcriptional regulator
MHEIVPGQKLQMEDLANSLKVSKTPVQSALGILAKEGFLKLLPNKGYYAKDVTSEEITELYQIRESLEILSIKNAISNSTSQSIDRLQDKKLAYENILKGSFGRNVFMYDMNFHLELAEIGRNRNLTTLLKQILERVYFTSKLDILFVKEGLDICESHEEIFDAIKCKNIDKAINCIRNHLRLGRDYLLNGAQMRKEFLKMNGVDS